MPRNDDLSLILAKAKLNGMLPDVKNEELDAIQQYANVLFSDDAALSATYTPYKQPAGAVAAGVVRPYDPTNCVWNNTPTTFAKGRAKIAAAMAGTALCKVAIVGDSTSAGIGPGTRDQSWPTFLREKLLPGAGLPVSSTGTVNPSQTPTSAQWAATPAGWSNSNSGSNNYMSAGNGSGAWTFTSTIAGTVVEIIAGDNYAGGTWTYSIDGGAAVTVTQGSGQFTTKTITGLANTTHTVTFNNTHATLPFILFSVEVRQANGLAISNMAQNGKTTAQWADTTNWYYLSGWLKQYNPDVVLIDLGINDWLQQLGTAAMKTNLQAIINLVPTADVVLINGYPSDPTQQAASTRLVYDQKIYELAGANGYPVVDFTEKIVSYAQGNANGLYAYGDHIHGSAAGYALCASAMVPAFH